LLHRLLRRLLHRLGRGARLRRFCGSQLHCAALLEALLALVEAGKRSVRRRGTGSTWRGERKHVRVPILELLKAAARA
jgi:hypothetical protein